jgi:hypothetical protein
MARQWRRAPPARLSAAAAAACAWLAGSATGQTTTTSTSTGGSGSSLWHYCTWTKYEPDEDSPAARHGHSLVGYQSKMVLFGGFDGAFSNTYMNDMWLWDVKPYMTVEVTAEEEAEGSEELGSAESIGDKYDAGHWRIVKQTGTIPTGRYGHAAAVVEETDLMVVFGGNSGGQDLLGDLWIFHLQSQLWTEYQETPGSPWPQPRSAATGTDVAGTVYIFGGWSSSEGPLAELWALDVAKDDLGNPTGVTWTLLRDSCSNDKVHAAQPERCVATDDTRCSAVDAAFEQCQRWTHSSDGGPQATSCPGSSGAGAPGGDCMFFHPNGTLPSGCAGRATVCARAGDCSYTAPNTTDAPCECDTLSECLLLEQRIATNWGLTEDEVEALGGSGYELCSMENGLDAVQALFDELDQDDSSFLESTEIAIATIRQKVPVTIDLNRDERLTVAEYALLLNRMPGPRCVAQHKDVCEAGGVNLDGSAATCEARGLCTYHPAVSARSCDVGPPARFGHAAVQVSIDLMVFGGHNGKMHLSDLWRYDTLTLMWAEIGTTVGDGTPIARSHLVAVPMSGGMLLWSGYSSECSKEELDFDSDDGCPDSDGSVSSEGFLEDLWQFANPAGTAIETATTTVRTLTQVIELKEQTLIVEDKEPEWNKYTSIAAGSTGAGAPEETAKTTFGANDEGKPYPRMGGAAVPLDMLSGFGVFGGESSEGLHADTWVLECGKMSNTWIWLTILAAFVFMLICYVGARYYKKYRRQRAALNRVTDLLRNIGRSGALNRNGIHSEAIAPLGNWKEPDGEGTFFVEGGVLDPPRILEYDVSKLTLSKKFVEDQKAAAAGGGGGGIGGKKHWVRCLSSALPCSAMLSPCICSLLSALCTQCISMYTYAVEAFFSKRRLLPAWLRVCYRPHCSVLFCSVLFCSVLFCSALFCSVLLFSRVS